MRKKSTLSVPEFDDISDGPKKLESYLGEIGIIDSLKDYFFREFANTLNKSDFIEREIKRIENIQDWEHPFAKVEQYGYQCGPHANKIFMFDVVTLLFEKGDNELPMSTIILDQDPETSLYNFTHVSKLDLGRLTDVLIHHFCEGVSLYWYIGFLKDLRNRLSRGEVITSKILNNKSGQSGLKKSFNTLKELFINDAAYIECMAALKKVDEPVISAENKYLLGLRQKGVFTAWFEIIKSRNKVNPDISASLTAKLLNKEIRDLNLGEDGSTLNRFGTSAYKKYKSKLSKFIS